uniref:Bile acid-CoA:amino acid N-acyltransferase n=1 Tax=Spermophilus dauricus TaxID=99837 RepID=A0A8C9PK87_SPEDA
MFQLTATLQNGLADELVHIQVTGLPPSQMVALKASLKDEKGNLFRSKAFYRANEAGEVDVERDPALGGDYIGVHAMGLFWSLKPEKAFQRLLKRDVINDPFRVTLDLYDSVCLQDSTTAQPRASQMVQRWFLGPGVQRKQIREGRVRGALFLLPEGPFPGITYLFGNIGGLVEFRASLLATHGFAVLALAYFAYEDLPEKLLELDLEYFEEVANFLLAHPKVVVTVCISGPNAVLDIPLRYRDLLFFFFPTEFFFIVHPDPCLWGCALRNGNRDPRNELNQQSVLPVEKAQGCILFIVGENDECWDSRAYAEQAMEQLKSHGRSTGKMLVYPGAGHLTELPYAPLCFASWSPALPCPVLWGGDPVAHAAAQEHSWGEIQKFFSLLETYLGLLPSKQ